MQPENPPDGQATATSAVGGAGPPIPSAQQARNKNHGRIAPSVACGVRTLPVPAKTARDIGPMILPNQFEAWLSPAARAPSRTPKTSIT